MTTGGFTISSENVAVTGDPYPACTWIVTVYWPASVGVPEMVPSVASVSPAGRAPPTTVHV